MKFTPRSPLGNIRMQWSILLLLFSLSLKLSPSSANDSYCGTEFFQAVNDCVLECRDDSECSDLGPDYSCFLYTGCSEKIPNKSVNVTEATDQTDVEAADADATIFDVESNSTISDAGANSSIFDMNVNVNDTIVLTGAPTALLTGAPTAPPVKTSRPTASPTQNPYLVSLQTATRKELMGNAGADTSTSYGFIFNVRTTADSPALYILGIDFLTSSTDNLDFELFSTIGSYVNIKGKYGRWVMIGKGTVTGQGMGSLTSISSDLISPIPMDGKGSIRAFYLTLRTKDMVFRVTSTGSSADEMVQLASDEIEIYEGESVQAFPFPDGETAGAYTGPSQFIGTVHYDTVPCKPLEVHGTIYALPCPVIPTASPAPSSMAPTTLSPTLSLYPSMHPSMEVTPEVSIHLVLN
jgi:hypothetical protein